MKLTTIALACSMAFAATAANAAVPTNIPTKAAIEAAGGKVIYISGASGVDTFLGSTIDGLIDVTTYVHDSSKNYRAWYGTSNSAKSAFIATGKPVLVIKRSAGGSAVGVFNVGLSKLTTAPLWTDAAATDEGVIAVAGITGNIQSYQVAVESAGTIAPDIGVSDVEPKMFSGINLESGLGLLPGEDATARNALTQTAWAQLAEGIVATKAVPTTSVLTNNFYREALAGHIQDWSTVDGSADPVIVCRRVEGSGTQAAYNSYFHGFPNSQAFNGYGQDYPAVTTDSFGYASGGGNGSTKALAIEIDPSAGFTVFEGSGAGDVRKCLQAAQMGKDTGPLVGRDNKYYNVKFSQVGGPSKAIGVLSLDSYTSASTAVTRDTAVDGIDGNGYDTSADASYVATNANATASTFTGTTCNTGCTAGLVVGNGEWNFRFLNGNGVYNVATQATTSATSSGTAPSRTNIINSSYDFLVEPTLQYKTSNAEFAAGQPKKVFFDAMLNLLTSPANVVNPNPNNAAPAAYAGLPTASHVKGTTSPTNLIGDLTRQGNTTAPLHVRQ